MTESPTHTCQHEHTLPQPYLAYGLSDEAAHHHAVGVDEQVGLGLCGSAQSHLLEAQLVVRDAPHVLSLKTNAHHDEDVDTGYWSLAPSLNMTLQQ